VFSHFIQNNVDYGGFENGETEYGDIFIGADGSNSKVRESIWKSQFYSSSST
jgi:2-polyprenyl-6-methoxyphenol hydroxylase-like FAD-dependent oxidoreductase